MIFLPLPKVSVRMDKAMKNEASAAFLYSAVRPDAAHMERFSAFLKEKYHEDIALEWRQDASLQMGLRLTVGSDCYNWSVSDRLELLQAEWRAVSKEKKNVLPLLKKTLDSWTPHILPEESGEVLSVGDGIARVSGLPSVKYGEILIFSDGSCGMVQDMREQDIGCILFGDDRDIAEGSTVKRTGKAAGIPVGRAFIGRVIDALGSPIDDRGPIEAEDYRPIERPAPGIIDRRPVNEPMETGLLAIDSMFPIGRGQRELIIGDRQTGKTAIALDTILNQKGKDVICIYVAIGQKASSVAQLTQTLREHDALRYSVVVCAGAGESAPLQYIAPYAGCALGEYFMEQGKDVLIVYDDLSKHAIAYRALSLLLERSPGREAYPGDVFYLHSRLLERSARLSETKGGGSMTALPIAETQAGDVSAYIPTNIISITDGQIFLESDLFFSGQRPAVNVGLSVSRVGGDAQTKAMKKAAGALRLELAQYREMEVFMQFASDLDESTRQQLAYGQGLMALLRQEQCHPMRQHRQVITLVAALEHVMQPIPVREIKKFQAGLMAYVEAKAPKLCEKIDTECLLSDAMRQDILDLAHDFLKEYAASGTV